MSKRYNATPHPKVRAQYTDSAGGSGRASVTVHEPAVLHYGDTVLISFGDGLTVPVLDEIEQLLLARGVRLIAAPAGTTVQAVYVPPILQAADA